MYLGLFIGVLAILVLGVFWRMLPTSGIPFDAASSWGGPGLFKESRNKFRDSIPDDHDLIQAAEEFGRAQEERRKQSKR